MRVNGFTDSNHSNEIYKSEKTVKDTIDKEQGSNENSAGDVAAIYKQEPSPAGRTGKTYVRDEKTIAKLKKEVEMRTAQLRSLVEEMILKQGHKFAEAEDIYRLLREGRLEVDPQTAAQAREEISENGYWGVKQTSERLFTFAVSLAGGDPAKARELKDAFIQGYKEAEKAWGGQLPEICRKTYEATIEKFDEWMKE